MTENLNPKQLDSLTGLRFMAALAVLLFHIPYVLPSASTQPILSDGALGVSFFFVLSGFILSHVYKREAPPKVFGIYL